MLSCFTDQNRLQNSRWTDYCESDPIVRKTKIITGRYYDNDNNGSQGCAGVLAPLHPALARSATASCCNWRDPGSGCEWHSRSPRVPPAARVAFNTTWLAPDSTATMFARRAF